MSKSEASREWERKLLWTITQPPQNQKPTILASNMPQGCEGSFGNFTSWCSFWTIEIFINSLFCSPSFNFTSLTQVDQRKLLSRSPCIHKTRWPRVNNNHADCHSGWHADKTRKNYRFKLVLLSLFCVRGRASKINCNEPSIQRRTEKTRYQFHFCKCTHPRAEFTIVLWYNRNVIPWD